MSGRFCGFSFIVAWAAAQAGLGFAIAQERSQASQPANSSEIMLQRSVNSREFQGRHYEGEERQTAIRYGEFWSRKKASLDKNFAAISC
jgi:hypothetical protein